MQIIYSLFFHYYFETEKLHYMHDSFRAHFKHLRLHVYFLLFFLQYRMHHKLRWTHWGNTILTSFCTRQYLLMHPVSFHLLFHILDFFSVFHACVNFASFCVILRQQGGKSPKERLLFVDVLHSCSVHFERRVRFVHHFVNRVDVVFDLKNYIHWVSEFILDGL